MKRQEYNEKLLELEQKFHDAGLHIIYSSVTVFVYEKVSEKKHDRKFLFNINFGFPEYRAADYERIIKVLSCFVCGYIQSKTVEETT